MSKEPNVGAAILGMYAGIKIARAAGIDWRRLGEIVLPIVRENEERERDDDNTDGRATGCAAD